MSFYDLRFRLLVKLGRQLFPEYRFKWPQLDWIKDETFNTFLTRFDELHHLNTERRWILKELLRLVDQVPGDTAECGSYEGAGSYIICQANAQQSHFERQHHIFDSFAGLSDPDVRDGSLWKRGDMAREEGLVRKNLEPFTKYSLHKGWIPERFPDVADRRFAFVHIDVDLYKPTLDSMKFFFERMNVGGIIVCDDYGFSTCPGATKAVNEVLADKPERMIAVPSGGGFMIKGTATATSGGIVGG